MATLPHIRVTWHDCYDVPSHRYFDWVFNCLFRLTSTKTSKIRLTGLLLGGPSTRGGFSSQKGKQCRKRFHCHDVIMIKNICTARASIQKHGTANVWPWEFNGLEQSAWIRRLEVRVPLRSRHFLSQKLWHFHKNTGPCVENECSCPRTVKISNVNFTSKTSYHAVAYV